MSTKNHAEQDERSCGFMPRVLVKDQSGASLISLKPISFHNLYDYAQSGEDALAAIGAKESQPLNTQKAKPFNT